MKRVPGWTWAVLLLLTGIVLSELPVLKSAERAIARSQGPLLAVTIGMTALGFALMMYGILGMAMAGDSSMTHEEIEASMRRQRDASALPYTWRRSTYRFSGVAAGRQGSMEASFSEIKDAWRTGEWRRDPYWRRFHVVAVGGLMLTFGLCGIFIVIGPMPIKLLMFGALAYATVRTVWGFAHA